MFTQFRVHYPNGSLVTELAAIDHGKYIVRCLVQVEGTTLVTSLAAAESVELAEDQARSRALAILGIYTTANGEKATLATSEVTVPLNSALGTPTLSDTPRVDTATLAENNLSQPPLFPETTASNAASPFESDTISVPPVVEVPPKTKRRSKREDTVNPTPVAPAIADESPVDVPSDEVEPFGDSDLLLTAEDKPQAALNDTSVKSYSSSESESSLSESPIPNAPVDFSDIIARTNVELKRLGWTNQQGRDYLVQTYGKRSRQLLTDGELLDFLHHLESEPAPED